MTKVLNSEVLTKEKIIKALKNVSDPELGYNIVDLGLVYDVEVENQKVKVLMTLTYFGCPLGDVLVESVKNTIIKLGAKDVEVELTFDPPWSPEKMVESIRKELGL